MFITASCAWAGYYNEGHYGLTEDDAYVIDSIADFVEFRNRINNGTDAEGLYYKLGISLNLEGTGDIELIGTTSTPFTGHFDGNGCTIKLKTSGPILGSELGLFGTIKTESGYAIKNLNVSGTVNGYDWTKTIVAGIVLRLYNASIENCSFTGEVTAKGEFTSSARAGGIAAEMYSGTIKNCTVKSATIKAYPYYVVDDNVKGFPGGIVSIMAGGTIENCIVDENCIISGVSQIDRGAWTTQAGEVSSGGIVGLLKRAEGILNKGSVKNNQCYAQIESASGSITSVAAGGIIGELGESNISIENNSYKGDISVSQPSISYIGGVIGKISGTNIPTISNNIYSGAAYGIGYDAGGNPSDEPGCINLDTLAVSITTTSPLPDGTVNTSYSTTLAAEVTGGTFAVTWSADNLPSWLTLNSSTGTLSGTPAAAGSYSFTVAASIGGGLKSASGQFTVTISSGQPAITLTISNTSLTGGTVGTEYSDNLKAELMGTSFPAAWAVTAGTWPAGLELNAATGEISGTPSTAGEYTFTVTASWSVYSASKEFTIVIAESAAPSASPEFKTHSLLLSGQIGVNFYMNLPEISGVDHTNSYMDFDIAGDSSNPPQYFDSEFMNKKRTYYGFRCYIKSIQMADPITAVLHYGDNQTVTHEYSAKKYLDDSLAADIPDTERSLIEAIKDFGHYAQLYLSRVNGWSLGTAHEAIDCENEYSDSDIEAARQAVDSNAIVKDIPEDSGIKRVGFSLNLDADTTINLYIYPEDGYTGSIAAYIPGSTTNDAVYYSDRNRYKVEISNIPAHRLAETFTVKVAGKKEFDVKVSAFSYVYAALNDANAQDDEIDTVVSLYRYYTTNMDYRAANGL